MKDTHGGVWGYTKKDWNILTPAKLKAGEPPYPHFFRNRIRICPNEGHQTYGRLFYPRPNFKPDKDHPGCPECMKRLAAEEVDSELEKVDEGPGQKRKAEV